MSSEGGGMQGLLESSERGRSFRQGITFMDAQIYLRAPPSPAGTATRLDLALVQKWAPLHSPVGSKPVVGRII